jgi:hypothetical protein
MMRYRTLMAVHESDGEHKSEIVEMTNPVEQSVGGIQGHLLRRTIHLSMICIPYLFFEFGERIASSISIERDELIAFFLIAIILGEYIRLKLGFTVFGQRAYEAHQVSALAWGGFSICLVLLIVPHEAYAYPLIISLALGDPFMGELRRKKVSHNMLVASTLVLLALIWMGAWHFFDTPLWFVPIMAPLCMVSEWPRYSIIDDNATMLLIPLAGVVTLLPFVN